MGVRVLYDRAEGVATLYDSTSGWAFGPVMSHSSDGTAAGARAEMFLAWLNRDARDLSQSELEVLWAAFGIIGDQGAVMIWEHDDLLDHLWDDHSGMDEFSYGDPLDALLTVHAADHAGLRAVGLAPTHTHDDPEE